MCGNRVQSKNGDFVEKLRTVYKWGRTVGRLRTVLMWGNEEQYKYCWEMETV